LFAGVPPFVPVAEGVGVTDADVAATSRVSPTGAGLVLIVQLRALVLMFFESYWVNVNCAGNVMLSLPCLVRCRGPGALKV
jgi:hypothetical protein